MAYNPYQIEKIIHDFIKEKLPDYYDYFHALDLVDIFDNRLEELLGYSLDILPDSKMFDLIHSKEAFMYKKIKTICLSESTYQGLINNNPRSRFTACHEITHVLLHDIKKDSNLLYFKSKNTDINNIIEYQADHGASAFLMPFHHVKSIISFGGNYRHINKFFNSSQEATRRRIEFVKEKMHEYRF